MPLSPGSRRTDQCVELSSGPPPCRSPSSWVMERSPEHRDCVQRRRSCAAPAEFSAELGGRDTRGASPAELLERAVLDRAFHCRSIRRCSCHCRSCHRHSFHDGTLSVVALPAGQLPTVRSPGARAAVTAGAPLRCGFHAVRDMRDRGLPPGSVGSLRGMTKAPIGTGGGLRGPGRSQVEGGSGGI